MAKNGFAQVRLAAMLVLLAVSLSACWALPGESLTTPTSAPPPTTQTPTVPPTTQHVHDFLFDGCMEPKRCLCGETDGEAPGHSWKEATCTAAKTCGVCGETEGEPLRHSWEEATCTAEKTCTVCGETEGEPLGHSWEEATCTAAKYCTVCGETEGELLGHSWDDATCTAPKHCARCDLTEGKPAGHRWKDATYTKPKTCTVCNLTSGSPKEVPGKENYHGHVYTGGSSSVKYHYEANCAGKYSHEITWEEVERRGLGPCGTCVLH